MTLAQIVSCENAGLSFGVDVGVTIYTLQRGCTWCQTWDLCAHCSVGFLPMYKRCPLAPAPAPVSRCLRPWWLRPLAENLFLNCLVRVALLHDFCFRFRRPHPHQMKRSSSQLQIQLYSNFFHVEQDHFALCQLMSLLLFALSEDPRA